MVVTIKRLLIIIFSLGMLSAVYLGFSLLTLPSVSDLTDRRHTTIIQVKDWKGRYHPFCGRPQEPLLDPSGHNPCRDEMGRHPC